MKSKLRKKRTFFDIAAAALLIFNVDWDDEYELLEVDDIFWDDTDWHTTDETTSIVAAVKKESQVS